MKLGRKQFTGRSLIIFVTAVTACILFFAGIASAVLTVDIDTQQLVNQRMAEKITQSVEQGFATNTTIFLGMQKSMMATMSETIKKNTAERKRASVIKTCMECRVGKPLSVEITGQTAILDVDTQTLINQKMAVMVKETIREKSSDPVVARSVQKRMMDERMKSNFLQKRLQPYMMGVIFGSTGSYLAEKKGADSVAQVTRDTPLLTMQKN